VQNFPRASVEDPEFAIQCVQDYDLETIESLYGNILELASALIRPMLKAPEGYTFFNADLSQIEARMTAWIAREEDVLQAYREGLDAYKVAAARMFHTPYDKVTKTERQAGKIAVLACGFQGASAALTGMAANYGIKFEDDEAQQIVNAFRTARPKLVRTWHAFGDAAAAAIQNPGNQVKVDTNHSFSFLFKDEFLFMQMPNGKLLSFPFAKYEMWMMPWGKKQMSVTHMWINTQAGSKWERRGISGASLMQSAVQGLSGCLLMEANLRLGKEGYDVRFRVHDELTSLVRDDASSNLEHFTKVFTQVPAWAEGLPVEADPWRHGRYKK
jgi:DNA polymerase